MDVRLLKCCRRSSGFRQGLCTRFIVILWFILLPFTPKHFLSHVCLFSHLWQDYKWMSVLSLILQLTHPQYIEVRLLLHLPSWFLWCLLTFHFLSIALKWLISCKWTGVQLLQVVCDSFNTLRMCVTGSMKRSYFSLSTLCFTVSGLSNSITQVNRRSYRVTQSITKFFRLQYKNHFESEVLARSETV